MPGGIEWNEWLKKFLEENIEYYEKQIELWEKRREVLKRRGEGWTDPEHPLQPQEKRFVGPDEAEAIDRAIKSADDLIEFYKKLIEKEKEKIRKLLDDVSS